MKVGYTSVFGYYFEVTKSHIDKVPYSYVRKQTLVNAERFITEELKELEDKILNAEQKSSVWKAVCLTRCAKRWPHRSTI